MAMVVKNNMGAVRTLNTLNKNSSALQKSLAKVSSGMKINSAQDDASGYAISEKMRVQIRSLDQANQNTQNASSLMKTAEGAVSSTMEILKSLKEKAVNAATDTNTDQDRATIQKELDQFIDQIDDNALTTFNGKYLVDGSKSQYGSDTFTAMTNQSLGLKDTDGNAVAGNTALTKLTNRNNDSLEISSADYVTASFVKNGETYTTKYRVDNTTLEDIFSKLNEVGGGSGGGMTEAQAKSTIQNASISALQGVINGSDTTSDLVKALQMVSDVSSLFKGESDLKAALQTPANGTSANQYLITGVYDGSTKVGSTYKSTKMTGTGTTLNTNRTNAINTAANAIKGVSVTSITDNTTIKYKGGATSSTAAADTEWSDGKNYLKGLVAAAAKAEADNAPSLTGGGGNSDSGPAAFGSAKVGSNPSGLVYVGTDVGLSSAGDMVGTANGESGVTVTAASGGIYGQISGLTISITDSEGNVKKSANAALDDFRTTVYAKNKSDSNEMTFQVGAKANQSITVGLDDMRAEALGLKGNSGTRVSVATQDKANAAIAVFDNAIQKVLDQQATIGAIEARLEYTSQNLTTSSENVQAAESTIRDADMAKEMTNYTKNNVLLQASQSMLAQANQNSSAVLSLLQ